MLRKKPAYIMKNAHALLAANKNIEQKDRGTIPNGHIGKTVKWFITEVMHKVEVLSGYCILS
jgi:hypothetical protein